MHNVPVELTISHALLTRKFSSIRHDSSSKAVCWNVKIPAGMTAEPADSTALDELSYREIQSKLKLLGLPAKG